MSESFYEKARSAYRQGGVRYLLRRGVRFLKVRFLELVLWRVLPKAATLRTIARSRSLTGLYHLLNGSFYREQRAILCGRAAYHELEAERREPRHRVIRNVHRLEKGLSMRDRRPVFAEGYIRELVGDLKAVWARGEPDDQLLWAMDVVAEYFRTVRSTRAIEAAEEEFQVLVTAVGYEPGGRAPFVRRELPEPTVSLEQLHQLARRRKSTRWFRERPVPRDTLRQAVKVALESPSACNRQSYEFRFYDDTDLIDRISELAIGATGYRQNIPCLAVLIGKQRAYFDVRDRHVIYIDGALAAMVFQLAIETRGLASCCINWPAIPRNERRMEERLGLECDEAVIMLMAIGFPDPDGMVPYSKKKNLKETCSFNRTQS